MACARQDKSLTRGENKTWRVSVVDADGEAVDCTGARAWMTIKEAIGDTGYIVRKDSDVSPDQIEFLSPETDGIFDVKLVAADSASINVVTHVYDVLLELASGKRYYVVKPSRLFIDRAVTEGV